VVPVAIDVGRHLFGREDASCVVQAHGVGERLLVRETRQVERRDEGIDVLQRSYRKAAQEQRPVLGSPRGQLRGLHARPRQRITERRPLLDPCAKRSRRALLGERAMLAIDARNFD